MEHQPPHDGYVCEVVVASRCEEERAPAYSTHIARFLGASMLYLLIARCLSKADRSTAFFELPVI
jgi:hypothetical protein